MLEIALQITLCLLIAAFIGFIIGFSVGRWGAKKSLLSEEINPVERPTEITKEEIEIPTQEAIANAVQAIEQIETPEEKNAVSTTEDDMPKLLDQPRKEGKDDLTQIKGIGPKVEEQLNKAGIYHLDQIARWTDANIVWLEEHTAFAHRAKKDLWMNQAKSLL